MLNKINFLTAGESHGKGLLGIIEGIPAGLNISEDYINFHLSRRQLGFGRGARLKIEKDQAKIYCGVRLGYTIGAPLGLIIENLDAKNWEDIMPISADSVDPKKITLPRPGHADLAGVMKYNFDDIRNVIERSSARETTMRVGLGSYISWNKKLNAKLSEAICSINAIKGVYFGSENTINSFGSELHDEIGYEKTYTRANNNAGGIEGGMSNAQIIVINGTMKPLSTLTKPLKSIDMQSKNKKLAHKERTDSCAVPAASIVAESMVCLVIADTLLDKFGGDSITELKEHLKSAKY